VPGRRERRAEVLGDVDGDRVAAAEDRVADRQVVRRLGLQSLGMVARGAAGEVLEQVVVEHEMVRPLRLAQPRQHAVVGSRDSGCAEPLHGWLYTGGPIRESLGETWSHDSQTKP
jgi:hypothetical protein